MLLPGVWLWPMDAAETARTMPDWLWPLILLAAIVLATWAFEKGNKE